MSIRESSTISSNHHNSTKYKSTCPCVGAGRLQTVQRTSTLFSSLSQADWFRAIRIRCCDSHLWASVETLRTQWWLHQSLHRQQSEEAWRDESLGLTDSSSSERLVFWRLHYSAALLISHCCTCLQDVNVSAGCHLKHGIQPRGRAM